MKILIFDRNITYFGRETVPLSCNLATRSRAAKQVNAAEPTDVTYRNKSFFHDKVNAAEWA